MTLLDTIITFLFQAMVDNPNVLVEVLITIP